MGDRVRRLVAIAALRARELVPVRVEDHATVLRLLSRRHAELGWAYNKAACRFHALMADLVPCGIDKELVVSQARTLLDGLEPAGTVAPQREALAVEMLDELERLTTARKTLRRRIGVAVTASGTSLTEVFGIAEIGAAMILGQVGDVARFPTADRFAAYNGTAPIEWSSGNPKHPTRRLSQRGNRTLNHVIHPAAVTQVRYAHSPGRGFYDRKRAAFVAGGGPATNDVSITNDGRRLDSAEAVLEFLEELSRERESAERSA